MASLVAGIAVRDISPPPGIRLSGFAGRLGGNVGVRDPLRAAAVHLNHGGNAVVLISLDVIGLTPEDDALLRKRVADRLATSPDAVMVCCSHTHSGPATMEIRATGEKEVEWTEEVMQRSVDAALEARDQSVPVRLSHASGYAFANVNRRLSTPRGTVISPNTGGPSDSIVRMLVLEAEDTPIGVVLQYEMHPVSLGSENMLVSADWVMHLRDRMESVLGCPVVFLQGCCGDVNPRIRGGDEATEMLGLAVAGSALSALRRLSPIEDPEIRWTAREALIPIRPLPTPEELVVAEARAHERLRKLEQERGSQGALDLARAEEQWIAACARLSSAPEGPPKCMDARVGVISIGSQKLIGLPGEIFTLIGDRIRSEVPGAWTVGYAAGNLGYLYPDDALYSGGYEVDLAYKLYGELQAGEGTADALTRAAVDAATEVSA